jgi:uncharacterized protein YjbI with pentapeptide repeats
MPAAIIAYWTIGLAALAALLLAMAIWWLWWWLPKREAARLALNDPKDRLDVEDDYRKTVGQALGGIAVLLGAGVAYLQFSQQQQSAHDLLISNQVSKGFEQLGNKDAVVVRLGGIYALEGVMNTSDQYHQPVLEGLTAFVRESAKLPTTPPTPGSATQGPPTDIQAALTVIGRRSAHVSDKIDLVKANLSGANLSGADLTHANLYHANLTDARLPDANLTDANLSGVNLSGAYLGSIVNPPIGANLTDAHLIDADLTHAMLIKANLSGADLSGAHLTNANLTNANLSGASLYGADLSGANLTNANLSGADLGDDRLSFDPGGVAFPPERPTRPANLSGAILTEANLSGVQIDQKQLDAACGSGALLPRPRLLYLAPLTLKPCPPQSSP